MDSELAPYRDLHANRLLRHPELGDCFAGEGRFLVGEMLRAGREGRLEVRSVLATPAAAEGLELPERVRLLVRPEAELQSLAGFPFHRGLAALARVPGEPPEARITEARRLLVLPRLDNAENLGALLRSAAALGMDGVLLGRGPSPFVPRALRVAMGATWRLPLWRREDPWGLLRRWREATGGEAVGAALVPGAEDARAWRPAPATALVLGPEDRGLDADGLAACDRCVAIPMASGMDSLNVAAAGAVLMFRMGA